MQITGQNSNSNKISQPRVREKLIKSAVKKFLKIGLNLNSYLEKARKFLILKFWHNHQARDHTIPIFHHMQSIPEEFQAEQWISSMIKIFWRKHVQEKRKCLNLKNFQHCLSTAVKKANRVFNRLFCRASRRQKIQKLITADKKILLRKPKGKFVVRTQWHQKMLTDSKKIQTHKKVNRLSLKTLNRAEKSWSDMIKPCVAIQKTHLRSWEFPKLNQGIRLLKNTKIR